MKKRSKFQNSSLKVFALTVVYPRNDPTRMRKTQITSRAAKQCSRSMEAPEIGSLLLN